jgi:hypothetical protein
MGTGDPHSARLRISTLFCVDNGVRRLVRKKCAEKLNGHSDGKDGKRSRIRTDLMPVKGKLGTVGAQFRRNLGTNDLHVL